MTGPAALSLAGLVGLVCLAVLTGAVLARRMRRRRTVVPGWPAAPRMHAAGERPAARPADHAPTEFLSWGVARQIAVNLVVPARGGERLPVHMLLRYHVADPYAVCAEFRRSTGDEVRWVFARDLLTEGLRSPAGDGDVRIWPYRVGGESGVRIALSSPDGRVLVGALARDLVEFLRASNALCPPGSEGDHVDVEGELRTLLAS